MKTIFKNIIVLAFVLQALVCQAQSQELDFTLTSESVSIAGQNVAIASTLTKVANTLTWVQINNGNTNTTIFTIISSSGDWDQGSSQGSIIYTMDLEGYQNTLSLSVVDAGFSALLSIQLPDNIEQTFSFNISTITYQ